MPNACRRAFATVGAAVSLLPLPTALNIAPAQAERLPGFCVPADVADNVCTIRLKSVTADVVNGTITGTPVNGGEAVTLGGQKDAYLKSAGFGDAPPEVVQRWDTAIDSVGALDVGPSNPNWYGNAKARVFLPRTLNDLATQLPDNVLMVGFTPDDAQPDVFRLVSIQPVSR